MQERGCVDALADKPPVVAVQKKVVDLVGGGVVPGAGGGVPCVRGRGEQGVRRKGLPQLEARRAKSAVAVWTANPIWRQSTPAD